MRMDACNSFYDTPSVDLYKLKKHYIVQFHVSCIHLNNEFPRATLITRDDRCIKRK